MENVSGWLHKSETTQGRTGCEYIIFLSASGSCKLRGFFILTQSGLLIISVKQTGVGTRKWLDLFGRTWALASPSILLSLAPVLSLVHRLQVRETGI